MERGRGGEKPPSTKGGGNKGFEGFIISITTLMSVESAIDLLERRCCYCGACIAICPVSALDLGEEGPVLNREKCTNCGLCTKICPTLNVAEALKAESIVLESYTARSTKSDVLEVCQDGGVVTSLLLTALERKMIDAAIVTTSKPSEPLKPIPVIAEDSETIIKSAGSKYSLSPLLHLLRRAISTYRRLAVVGLPCHIRALWLMKSTGLRKYTDPVKLTIGLFCMNNYPYSGIVNALRTHIGVEPDDVTRIDIKRGMFIVRLKQGYEKSIKVSVLKKYATYSCRSCPDLTSWMADLSVGSIGSEDGWSTVLVRTNVGRELIKYAIDTGIIVVKKLDKEGLEAINKLSERKKRRLRITSPH